MRSERERTRAGARRCGALRATLPFSRYGYYQPDTPPDTPFSLATSSPF